MINKFYQTLIFVVLLSPTTWAQMQATFLTNVNSNCDGVDCYYDGPSILINEIMISPPVNDGSLFENGNDRQGEWIELYNPNICEPVDISCYYLGNNAPDGANYGAGLQIPQGTIIPPAGFCVIRGKNAPPIPPNRLVQNGGNVVEIVPTGQIVCMQGTRLWFPNAGGWFAFYDRNGVPQDAISWGNQNNIGNLPCVANSATCNTTVSSLASYNSIPTSRKTKIYGAFPDDWGRSIRRVPDGGSWVTNTGTSNPTPGDCNANCAIVGTSTCNGSATVQVAGGTPPYSYLWNDSQAQTTPTAIDLCAGTYNVIVTDNNGITQTFSVTIEDFVPDVSFSFIEDICNEGQTIPFTDFSPVPTSNQTGIFTGTGVSGNTFDASLSGDGQFQITYTFSDENDCTNSADVIINVHHTPNATISGLAPNYCISDDEIPFTTSPSGGNLFGNGIQNNTFSLMDAGIGTHTITYSVTTEFGCSDTETIQVSIFDNPQLQIQATDTFCGENNGEIQLSGLGGTAPYQYSIDNGASFHNNNTFTGLSGGSYSLIITDANGCSNSRNIQLVSLPFPNISAPNDMDICIGDMIILEANNPDSAPIFWNNNVQNGVPFIPPNIGNNVYIVSSTIDNCTTKDSVTVTVHALPNVSGGGDLSICKEDTVILYGYGAQTYSWSNGVTNGSPFVPQITQNYTVTGTDIWGCINEDTIEIIVNPLPNVDFFGDTLLGCNPFEVIFANTSNLDGIVDCHWDFGDGVFSNNCENVKHIYNKGGFFDVTLAITDTNGCVGKFKQENYVQVILVPKANFYAQPNNIIGTSTPIVNFVNVSVGAESYYWDFGVGIDYSTSKHTNHRFPDDKAGEYLVTLYAYNELGCVDSMTQVIRLIEDLIYYVPNSFTPDDDEFNQVFLPVFSQGYNPEDYNFKIFNRWGELVFESHDVSAGWDGLYGGYLAPDGVYVWQLEFGLKNSSERKTKMGHLTLIR